MKVRKDRMKAYLQRINAQACSLCGEVEWSVSEYVFQAIEFDGKGVVFGGAAYPMVPITCDNCGNTYFINAFAADLIDKEALIQAIQADKKDDPK